MYANKDKIDKLITQARRVLAAEHKSLQTEKSYIAWIARFTRWIIDNPAGTSEQKINAYLSHLANDRHVSPNTQAQALNAIVYLYKKILRQPVGAIGQFHRPPRRKNLPTVLSQAEIMALLHNLTGVHWLIGNILYGAGLRIRECLNLRTQDIDLDRHQIMVRAGKGSKDRAAILPATLIAPLKNQIETARRIHRRDLSNGYGEVYLPHALERKNRHALKDFKWKYIFQASKISTCHRTGVMRRHHLHATAVGKALRQAARAAGIGKRVTAHTLRHSFATHLIERGVDISTVQTLLGHSDVRTTRIYIHVAQNAATSIKSPLEAVA